MRGLRLQLSLGAVALTAGLAVVASGVPAGAAPAPTTIKVRTGETLSELTVLTVDGRTVLAVVLGDEETEQQWLPLLHDVVESLRFP